MKKSCILEILTPIRSTSKCLRIDSKIRTKKDQKICFLFRNNTNHLKLAAL